MYHTRPISCGYDTFCCTTQAGFQKHAIRLSVFIYFGLIRIQAMNTQSTEGRLRFINNALVPTAHVGLISFCVLLLFGQKRWGDLGLHEYHFFVTGSFDRFDRYHMLRMRQTMFLIHCTPLPSIFLGRARILGPDFQVFSLKLLSDIKTGPN